MIFYLRYVGYILAIYTAEIVKFRIKFRITNYVFLNSFFLKYENETYRNGTTDTVARNYTLNYFERITRGIEDIEITQCTLVIKDRRSYIGNCGK